MMLKRCLGLAVAAVLIPALSACSNHPGVIRAQSPDLTASIPTPADIQQGTMISYGHPAVAGDMGGYGCPTGDCYSYGADYGYGGGYAGGFGGGYCDQPWMHDGGYGYGKYPNHRHSYSYKRPKNLVYPPANSPAAVVQYPYYTTKGPSDFFYGMR